MPFTQEDANSKIGALVTTNWVLEKALKEALEKVNERVEKTVGVEDSE